MTLLANQKGGEQMLHSSLYQYARPTAHVAKANAFNSITADDLHQAIVAGMYRASGEGGDTVEGELDGGYFDAINDGHGIQALNRNGCGKREQPSAFQDRRPRQFPGCS
jgi:hypothetical protein